MRADNGDQSNKLKNIHAREAASGVEDEAVKSKQSKQITLNKMYEFVSSVFVYNISLYLVCTNMHMYMYVCVVLIATVSALTQRSDGFVIIENLIRFSIKPNKCCTHTLIHTTDTHIHADIHNV